MAELLFLCIQEKVGKKRKKLNHSKTATNDNKNNPPNISKGNLK